MRGNQFRQPEEEGTMVYGTRAVIEAIRSGKDLERLFIQNGLNNPLIRELKDEIREAGIQFLSVPAEKLNRLTRSNHQGVIGIISTVTYAKIENVLPGLFEKGKNPLIIILDRITDTRNLGAIARSAECAGAHAIIIPSRGSALINSDAIKTSAGALHHIPVCREDNLKDTIEYLKSSGLKIISCTEKTDKYTFEADFKEPLAIIMGSEENGVSGEYLKRSDFAVKIPMAGTLSSYNVSVAAGMVLYEVLVQRRKI
ncbi:23S rRNA (guanosine(2251)-2'-O)-methyltransferase RlmB [soil metagenome]